MQGAVQLPLDITHFMASHILIRLWEIELLPIIVSTVDPCGEIRRGIFLNIRAKQVTEAICAESCAVASGGQDLTSFINSIGNKKFYIV